MDKTGPRRRLTARRKLELYVKSRDPKAPLGEILRRYGVHLDDLREIEGTVETAALAALKAKNRRGRRPTDTSPERVMALEAELAIKSDALEEMSIAYGLLRKKDRAACSARARGGPSAKRNAE